MGSIPDPAKCPGSAPISSPELSLLNNKNISGSCPGPIPTTLSAAEEESEKKYKNQKDCKDQKRRELPEPEQRKTTTTSKNLKSQNREELQNQNISTRSNRMKLPLLIALLVTAVLCRPARKVSVSSSESSEEVVRRPSPALRRQSAQVSLSQSSSLQRVSVSSNSDDSGEASEEQQAVVDLPEQLKSAPLSVSDSVSATASTSASTQSPDSEDSEDSDEDDEDDEKDEDDDTDESETEEEESESSESGEASTVSTATVSPVIVTEDVSTTTFVEEITPDAINPTIITDDTADSGRGDSLGAYPSDYKTIVYVEDKSYHKLPETHKSWDYSSSKKSAGYEPAYGNEVHKAFKIYKGVQVHHELLEEDTSTPEVENQSLDTPSGLPQDVSPRQTSLDLDSSLDSKSVSTSESSGTSDSSGTAEEEEQAKADSISSDSSSSTPEDSASTPEDSASTPEDSASTSEESPEGESLSQSSEEATATPGAADSQSDESDSDESQSDEDAVLPELTTDLPVVITAK
ncbi:hypothetical protein WMY93_021367 [Mugilogobius chulae]|uniref:Osteopontin n=1 Tax=Mugilogobius chulae TaxID=88201 RepID=A0AAW0NKZ2_9GOBI